MASFNSEAGHEDDTDIDKIPDPVPRGLFKPVRPSAEPVYITVDLETTDLIRGDKYPHITQIAAKHVGSDKIFNSYVIPKLPMSAYAEKMTKIVVTSGNVMHVDGVLVEAKTIQTALGELLCWLKQFQNMFLIAHNGRRFDFPIIIKACQDTEMLNEFCTRVLGLVDSLPVFKSVYPECKSHKQEELARMLLSKEYNAHNAIDDVECLSELVSSAVKQNDKCMTDKSFAPIDIKNSMDSNLVKRKHLPSLSVLVANGVMKS